MDVSEKLRLQQWASDMADFQNSRLTRKQWCEVHDININTFGYRCTPVRHAAKEFERQREEQSRFVMIPAPSKPAEVSVQKEPEETASKSESRIFVYFDQVALELPYDAPETQVRTILEVLSHAE
ncbi:IS66 family insertion sequence element accessory protein TnpA [Eubacterium sp. F2]|uniref:IS66 family insertion sequence element accessory protein TnpA n=1 Tax=Eubacterium sp. F2 TaxID=3381348 RepID=UPI003907EDFA